MAKPTYQDLLNRIQKLEKENKALVDNERTLKDALNELQNAHDKLEASVANQTRELQTSNESLQNEVYKKELAVMAVNIKAVSSVISVL